MKYLTGSDYHRFDESDENEFRTLLDEKIHESVNRWFELKKLRQRKTKNVLRNFLKKSFLAFYVSQPPIL
ncbi:MAG: hypothetical protein B7Y39_12525 [Bdellovibrio sp. 28-41-41]|nr:MAG: hypothetical protein B7Y39_12525 [Bdellovibrio sp. 28-41-41]